MSLQVAHGSIEWLTSTTAGGTYSQGDVGFTIKALIFWWTGIASGGSDSATQAVDMRRGVGVAVGTSARRCIASYDDDAALTSDSSTAAYNDCIAATHSNAAARDGALDVTAMGTGFTLTVDDQLPTGNLTLHWLAIGGSDVDVQVVGDFAEPASATTVDVPATGLTSDGANQMVMVAGVQSTAAVNSVSAENGGISIGFATGTGASEQWCIAGSTDHASGTTDTDGIGGTGKVVAQAPLASGTTFVTAALSAWGTDQFTVSYSGTVVSGRKNIFLAIKGGGWAAGSYTIEGDTGSDTATVSALPFVPKGIIVGGRMNAAQNAATGNANDRLGLGWGTSTSSRRTQGVLNENATASSAVEVDQVAEFDAVLAFPSTAGALQAAYDINAMNSDGFEIIVDTAGGVASEWQGYLAFGNEPIPIGQASETDEAQALTVVQTFALDGIDSVAPSRLALPEPVYPEDVELVFGAATLSAELGQVTETDLAQAVSAAKARALGQVAETDLAQAVTVGGVAVAQASETDLAQAITAGLLVALNQASETDLAQAVTSAKALAIAQASETDLAQAVSGGLAGSALDGIDSVAPSRLVLLEPVYPEDVELIFEPAALGGVLGQASETDLAQAIAHAKAALLGQASETDEAQAVTSGLTFVLGQVLEQDEAQAVSAVLTGMGAELIVNLWAEDTGLEQWEAPQGGLLVAISAPPAGHTVAVGQASETDLAQALTHAKAKAIAQASETDLAQAVGAGKAATLGQATETDLAQAVTVSGSKLINVGQAEETDEAQAITWAPKIRQIGQASEADSAQALVVAKRVVLGQAEETDAAQGMGRAKVTALLQAFETDSAQQILPAGAYATGQASETDEAFAMVWIKDRRGWIAVSDVAVSRVSTTSVVVNRATVGDSAVTRISTGDS